MKLAWKMIWSSVKDTSSLIKLHKVPFFQVANPMDKIDWHNYRQIAEEEERKGT